MVARRLCHEHTVEPARFAERALFWCALGLWLALFPVTLTLFWISLRSRSNNPARTGGVISRHRKRMKRSES